MTSESWHDVLTLMAMVILADKRVYKEEVDTFVESITELNNKISPDMFMTQSMAFEWFKSNRERVKNLLIGKDAKTNVRETVLRVGNLPHKPYIVECMRNIANADNEYHSSEHSVIKQAAYNWKIAI